MNKTLVILTALATCGTAGCGGGSSSTTASAPSPITRAVLIVSQTSVGLVGLSPTSTHLLRVTLPVEIRAMNATACNLSYARLSLYRAGTEIERSEVTANEIVALAGTNRVANDRTLTFTITFDFNSLDFDNAAILLGAADDAGNTFETALSNLRIEVDPAIQ